MFMITQQLETRCLPSGDRLQHGRLNVVRCAPTFFLPHTHTDLFLSHADRVKNDTWCFLTHFFMAE